MVLTGEDFTFDKVASWIIVTTIRGETKPLLDYCDNLTAIEIEQRAKNKFDTCPNVTLVDIYQRAYQMERVTRIETTKVR